MTPSASLTHPAAGEQQGERMGVIPRNEAKQSPALEMAPLRSS
ncbi:MAG: hypothetical protein NZT92_00750 [Abditibacteriales bacterium]|nr:hypothetical protein [Abditibacteriales bacterium]